MNMNSASFHRRRFLSLLPAAVLAGCSEDKTPKGPRFPKVKWRIISTTHFTADVVRIIGGEAVQSLCFVPPGVNPHEFRPDGPDIAKFHTSDMVFINGLGLENRWPQDFEELAKGNVKVVSVTSGIPQDKILRPSGPGGPPDPHVWNAPDLAISMVETVASTLKEVMPKLADYFNPRAHRLKLDFENILTQTGARMKELKDSDRFLLTSHDSMQYFARTFGLQARALTTADGKVPAQLPESLKEWITSHKVRSLFREPFTDVLALRSLLGEVRVNPDNVIYSLTLPPAETTGLVSMKPYDVAQAYPAQHYNADSVQFTLRVD